MEPHDKLYAAAPAIAGGGTYTAQVFGLSVPDWVGVFTVIYLVVMTVLAILRHLEKRNGRDRS